MKHLLILLTLILLKSSSLFADTRVKAEGVSLPFKKDLDSMSAKAEALQAAQLNALKSYGGCITYGSGLKTNKQTEKMLVDKKYRTNEKFSSTGTNVTFKTISGVVKPFGEITYKIVKTGRRTKCVIASGTFVVDMENTGGIINSLLTSSGEKIRIEFNDSSNSNSSMYAKLRTYFNKDRDNFEFCDVNGKFLTTQVYILTAYSDHIDIMKRRIRYCPNPPCNERRFDNGPIIKTVLFKSCKDFDIKASKTTKSEYQENEVLDKIMKEVYKIYLTDKIKTF
jgi:hypothetical protein